jgi:hypothetical protein
LDKVVAFLSEWVFYYVKNRDLVDRKLEKVEEYINKSYVFAKFKDKLQVYFIEPEVEDLNKTLERIGSAKKETNSEFACLVLLNSLNNLKAVEDGWSRLDKDPKFSLLFVNPFSLLDKKWIIFPHTHSRIIEPSTLKQGLKSLFDGVEAISADELESKIKQ